MSLEVIAGPMFAGKTRALLYTVKRTVMFGHRKAVLYVPERDDRHPGVSHDGDNVAGVVSVRVVPANATALPLHDNTTAYFDLIAVDEVQLMSPHVAESIVEAANHVRVVVAGLDMDFAGHPFPPMDRLLSVADKVTKLTAVCVKCGEDATHSRRKVHDRHKVLVGGSDLYEARCRSCWRMGDGPST